MGRILLTTTMAPSFERYACAKDLGVRNSLLCLTYQDDIVLGAPVVGTGNPS